MKKITDVEAVRRQIPPEILEKLSERYESFECISGGATSSVFKAHDKILSKPVALKVLLLSDTRELIRFQKEAQAASKLNHPNLMTAMDFNVTQDNRAYIVMDFVDGVSVEEWVKTEGELPMSAAIDIAKQIARGMSTAHQQGVVHRDLKTSNVMMSERGPKIHVTVIDFGLARLDHLQHETLVNGLIQGSPLYMSPEQARGEAGDLRSDIYSLACIIFRMIAGRTPFESSETLQLIQMHNNAKPPLLSEVADCRVPRELDQLLAQMLAKDPDRRPQSMAEVNDKLSSAQEATEAGTIAAPSSTSGKRSVLFMLLFALVIGGGITLWILRSPSEKVTPPQVVERARPLMFSLEKEKLIEGIDGTLISEEPDKLLDEDLKPLGTWEYLIDRGLSQVGDLVNFERKEQLRLVTTRPRGLSLHKATGITGSGLKYVRNHFEGIDLSETNLSDEGYKTLGTFSSLKKLMLDKCKTTDDQLASLSSLQSLEHLNLSHCLQITDEGMLSVGRMANLKKLDLTDTKISDDGLKYLKGLEHLEMIILANTRVTDAGVRQLKRTKLEGIELQGCRGVTIKTLQFLISDFPNLKQLSIFDTAIKPSDYYLIGKLKDLNFLVVVNTPLDKRTLQAIGGLTKLSELSIADNSLTDDDLLYFSNLHDLKNLYAKSQKFTKPGQMKLSDRLEKCRIISEFGLQRVLPGFDDFYFEPLHP